MFTLCLNLCLSLQTGFVITHINHSKKTPQKILISFILFDLVPLIERPWQFDTISPHLVFNISPLTTSDYDPRRHNLSQLRQLWWGSGGWIAETCSSCKISFSLCVWEVRGQLEWREGGGIALKDKHLGVYQPANGPCVYSAEDWTAAGASLWPALPSTAYVGAIRWNLHLIHDKWDCIEQQGCW